MTSLISRFYNFPIHGGKIEMVRGSSIGGVHPCTKECDNKKKNWLAFGGNMSVTMVLNFFLWKNQK